VRNKKTSYNSHLALINKWCAKMCELKQMYITQTIIG